MDDNCLQTQRTSLELRMETYNDYSALEKGLKENQTTRKKRTRKTSNAIGREPEDEL